MKILFALVVVTTWVGSVAAQTGQTCDVIAAQFFKQVQEEKYGEAIDQAFATNPYSAKMAESIKQLRSQFASAISLIGKYHSNELLLQKTVANRYAYLYYFVAFDRQPMKFEFHCYRGSDRWVLQNFEFSDKIGSDIAAWAREQAKEHE